MHAPHHRLRPFHEKVRCLLALAGSLIALGALNPVRADEASDRLTLAVDALTRLEGLDLQANPAMKERVLRVLARTRGTANFVRLVRHFSLPDQEAGLVEVATALPKEEGGVDAVRLLLSAGKTNVLASVLAAGGAPALALAEALGNSGKSDAARLLLPLLQEKRADSSADLQAQVIRSLSRTAEGARELLSLVKAGHLDDPQRKLALDELAQTRWETLKSEAIHLRGQTMVKWPSVPELVKLSGDRARGQAIYFRANPGCYNCHVVHGRGTDLGPNLSEIGGKLGKDALYQAILEPSAGISFGYETFTVTLKGGEEAYGLIASETAAEVAIKTVGGVVVRYPKTEIVSREKSTLSLMPAGLEAGLTPQELADLVEFLAALRKGTVTQ